MKMFVTGASGVVGGAATRHLAALGHDVFAMSRSDASDAKIRAAGGAPVRCDLDNVAVEHLQGADAVIHCAAYVEAWGPKDVWHRFNVLGTQRMLDAAHGAGVKRFIHIGTEAAIMHGQHVHDADETYPLAPQSPYPYCATKAQAEMKVRGASTPDCQTIVLRPRFIWGPGDTTLLPIIKRMAEAGNWIWIDGGKAVTSTTHIDNLIHAIALALERGTPGEAYFILDDGDVSMREMITGMAESEGVQLPDKSIPSWIAGALGAASEAIWRAFGIKGEPPLTRHAVMVMSRDCTLKDDKARAELSYVPVVSRAQGLESLRQSA